MRYQGLFAVLVKKKSKALECVLASFAHDSWK